MLAIFLKWLGDEALSTILSLVQAETAKRNLIAQGQAQQAARETGKSASMAAAIAEAEASAPQSKSAALDRLKGGTA